VLHGSCLPSFDTHQKPKEKPPNASGGDFLGTLCFGVFRSAHRRFPACHLAVSEQVGEPAGDSGLLLMLENFLTLLPLEANENRC
jgi:hypothetical protein